MLLYVVLPFYEQELVSYFEGSQMGLGPLGFLANPQLLTDFICLYQLLFELG